MPLRGPPAAHCFTAVTERRVAGAPISWGVCEVPGWGLQLDPERVLAEMAELGLTATELGPVGWLPLDGTRIRSALAEHDLELVAGFAPLILHRPTDDGEAELERLARALAGGGASMVLVAPIADLEWTAPVELGREERARLVAGLDAARELLARHGLELVIHPHAGSLVESSDQIEWLLEASDVGWCLDTGHLAIAGVDPVEFAELHSERVVHVHLKDVDLELARAVGEHRTGLVEATKRGLFRALGDGDIEVRDVIDRLDRRAYDGWLVLEQDVALSEREPAPGTGPIADVRRSLEFARHG